MHCSLLDTTGQRVCIGEPLALQLVFIYTTALIQTFRMRLFLRDGDTRYLWKAEAQQSPTSCDPESSEISPPTLRFEEGQLGLTYSPQPFKILLTSRRDLPAEDLGSTLNVSDMDEPV